MRFWLFHLSGLFLLFCVCIVYALSWTPNLMVDQDNLRVTGIINMPFGTSTIVSNKYHSFLVTNQSLPIGEIFAPKSVKIIKTFSLATGFEQYYLGRNIVAQIQISPPTNYTCDTWCKVLQFNLQLRRYVSTSWDTIYCHNIFISSPSCADTSQLASGLLIGGQTHFSPALKAVFIQENLYHVLVVSGFQIAIISLLLERGTNWLKAPIVLKHIIIIGVLIIYSFITGFEPPVLRSLISVIISSSILLLLGRKITSWHSIFYTLLLMIFFQPWLVYSLSFQLSILATIGVIWSEKLITFLPEKIKLLSIPITTCLTFIFTLPVTANFGNEISLTGIIANLIVLPCIPILSFLALISLLPGIGSIFGAIFILVSNWLQHFLYWLSAFSYQHHFDRKFFSFSLVESCLYLALLFLVLVLLNFLLKRLTKARFSPTVVPLPR